MAESLRPGVVLFRSKSKEDSRLRQKAPRGVKWVSDWADSHVDRTVGRYILVAMKPAANKLFAVIALPARKLRGLLSTATARRVSGGLQQACAVALLSSTVLAGEAPVLVPPPREVKWSVEPPAKLVSGAVAIVMGRQATAPEQQAARLLQEAVAKRFGQTWPIRLMELPQ